MRVSGILALALVAAFAAKSADAQSNPPHALICAFDRQFMCLPNLDRCNKVDPAKSPGWALIDFDTGTYSICEPQGCKTLKAIIQQDGVYLDISLPGGAMAKLEAGSNRLMEVTTVLLGTFVSYMNCRPAK